MSGSRTKIAQKVPILGERDNAHAELNAPFGRQACVAFDHTGLHLDRAAQRIDHAAELDDDAVPVR
jgi:hypothetical protein